MVWVIKNLRGPGMQCRFYFMLPPSNLILKQCNSIGYIKSNTFDLMCNLFNRLHKKIVQC